MLLADDDNANITANNQRVIINDPKHTYFGKWGRIIDTDAVTRSWLVAIEAAGYLSRHRSAMRTRPSG